MNNSLSIFYPSKYFRINSHYLVDWRNEFHNERFADVVVFQSFDYMHCPTAFVFYVSIKHLAGDENLMISRHICTG